MSTDLSAHHCTACGYDLQGQLSAVAQPPADIACPECGAGFDPVAAANEIVIMRRNIRLFWIWLACWPVAEVLALGMGGLVLSLIFLMLSFLSTVVLVHSRHRLAHLTRGQPPCAEAIIWLQAFLFWIVFLGLSALVVVVIVGFIRSRLRGL